MYRHRMILKNIWGGHRLARATVLALTFVTTVCMLWTIPMVFIGRSRHAAWDGSGLDNAAFFTRNYRFDWNGFGLVPPAYGKLKEYLNRMDGCTAVSVDYADAYLADRQETAVLCIYPEILRESIHTPLSAGSFDRAADEDSLPIVLDSRLRDDYSIGDEIPIVCSWDVYIPANEEAKRTSIETTAVVTGFLTSHNDHISTLGGSNAQMLLHFAAKAMNDDGYMIVTAENPIFGDKPYTGDVSSMLLLPPNGERVADYIVGWRQNIAAWNLGQIDSYQEIYESDLWSMSVMGNVDYYLLTAWLILLTAASLVGYNLMRTDCLRHRLSLFGLIGMTKGKMLTYMAIGNYLPFWLVNCIGLSVGHAIAASMYRDYKAVALQVIGLSMLVTMFPHILALCVDVLRTRRMEIWQQWNSRR